MRSQFTGRNLSKKNLKGCKQPLLEICDYISGCERALNSILCFVLHCFTNEPFFNFFPENENTSEFNDQMESNVVN